MTAKDWSTHTVDNVVAPLVDWNCFTTDVALVDGLRRAGGETHLGELGAYGAQLGSAAIIRAGEDANRYLPELDTFDRIGRRVDTIRFHPGWHQVAGLLRAQGLNSQPFSDDRPGAWSAYAAGFSMHSQIEAGSLCPASMTFASIPVLRRHPALFAELQAGLYSRDYDPADAPIAAKRSLQIGMGMTEKQGGSDVRSNRTTATPAEDGGHRLVGHKWFFSAPMCDAHLVVARDGEGVSCFFVPRFLPDGSRNGVRIQRLKNKLGNKSNASSEIELQDAWGLRLGEPGRGIPTIIEMATHTRLNCVMGSAGLIRQAVVQAIHHARHRQVFGRRLAEQPIMQNVLADLALESEAATVLMLALAEAFGQAEHDPVARALQRLVTPAAKFWVCKRAIEVAGEAMEVLGGNGYVEEAPLARIFREMPVNSIWEGSGNVMALDLIRAIGREPVAGEALLAHLDAELGSSFRPLLQLKALLALGPGERESVARRLAQELVLVVQAALLRRHAPAFVADAFVASRFDAEAGRVFGTMPIAAGGAIVAPAILARAWPV